jgi:hypothetical protein
MYRFATAAAVGVLFLLLIAFPFLYGDPEPGKTNAEPSWFAIWRIGLLALFVVAVVCACLGNVRRSPHTHPAAELVERTQGTAEAAE